MTTTIHDPKRPALGLWSEGGNRIFARDKRQKSGQLLIEALAETLARLGHRRSQFKAAASTAAAFLVLAFGEFPQHLPGNPAF